jgi:ATP-dependent DNA ligase
MLKRPLPAGFVVPDQPVEREKPPTGAEWIHEIKHDGYRMIVRKEGENVGLHSRNAIDWTALLPAIAGGAALLRAKSFTLDGEAVVIGQDGLTDFEALRRRGVAYLNLGDPLPCALRSRQFGRASAPIIPQLVHTVRGATTRT